MGSPEAVGGFTCAFGGVDVLDVSCSELNQHKSMAAHLDVVYSGRCIRRVPSVPSVYPRCSFSVSVSVESNRLIF